MKYFFYTIFFAVLLVSCRTSEQLIDLAIKRNPSIQIGTNDTIEITNIIIDSIPVIINDSIVYEKIIRVIKTDTIIKNNSVFIERKKSRQEIRYLYKLEKQNNRLNNKIEKLEARLKEKNERIRIRNESKNERISNRSKWWIWLIIGLIIGFFLRIIFKTVLNKFI